MRWSPVRALARLDGALWAKIEGVKVDAYANGRADQAYDDMMAAYDARDSGAAVDDLAATLDAEAPKRAETADVPELADRQYAEAMVIEELSRVELGDREAG